jgi:hypothetical protein
MVKKYFKNNVVIVKKYLNLKINKRLVSSQELVIKNNVIKKHIDYIIYKEISSDVYILSIPKLLVIQYKYTKNIEDVLLLYAESDLYFDIYKNDNYYYVVCVSKYKDIPFDYNLWLKANDANYKYILLTDIYNSFLIINKTWYSKSNIYTFYKSVGNGIINNEIKNKLQLFIKIINEMQYLPSHYLNI